MGAGQADVDLDSTVLAAAYDAAKTAVVCAGHGGEIEWQRNVSFEEVTEADFLREHAWVVLCCGMRESVVRARFPQVGACFHGWKSARRVLASLPRSRERALKCFHHPGKINAIITCAGWVAEAGFASVKETVRRDPVRTLQSLPFIGPVTAYHLAKNLGIPVAKPDRHLVRLAAAAGYGDVQAFCTDIAACSGDSVPVVDIVLWRFATLRSDYLRVFSTRLRRSPGSSPGAQAAEWALASAVR
jgi:hypothetical protein